MRRLPLILIALFLAPMPAAAQGGNPAEQAADAITQILGGPPEAEGLMRPVDAPPFSSFGNQPAIEAGPVQLSAVATIKGQLPPDKTFIEFSGDVLQQGGWSCGDTNGVVVLCPPGGVTQTIPNESFLIFSGAVDGPLPLSGPFDSLLEAGVMLRDASRPVYPSDPQFPSDYFTGLNSSLSLGFGQGRWTGPLFRSFNSEQFTLDEQPAPAISFVSERAFVHLFQAPSTVDGARVFTFRTNAGNPFQPDTVVANAFPSATGDPFPLSELTNLSDLFAGENGELPVAANEGSTNLIWVLGGAALLIALVAAIYLKTRSTPQLADGTGADGGPGLQGPSRTETAVGMAEDARFDVDPGADEPLIGREDDPFPMSHPLLGPPDDRLPSETLRYLEEVSREPWNAPSGEDAKPQAEAAPAPEERDALGGILEGFAGMGAEHSPGEVGGDVKAGGNQPPAEDKSGEGPNAEGPQGQSDPGDANRD